MDCYVGSDDDDDDDYNDHDDRQNNDNDNRKCFVAPLSSLPLRGAPDYCTDTESEFHAKTHWQLRV